MFRSVFKKIEINTLKENLKIQCMRYIKEQLIFKRGKLKLSYFTHFSPKDGSQWTQAKKRPPSIGGMPPPGSVVSSCGVEVMKLHDDETGIHKRSQSSGESCIVNVRSNDDDCDSKKSEDLSTVTPRRDDLLTRPNIVQSQVNFQVTSSVVWF